MRPPSSRSRGCARPFHARPGRGPCHLGRTRVPGRPRGAPSRGRAPQHNGARMRFLGRHGAVRRGRRSASRSSSRRIARTAAPSSRRVGQSAEGQGRPRPPAWRIRALPDSYATNTARTHAKRGTQRLKHGTQTPLKAPPSHARGAGGGWGSLVADALEAGVCERVTFGASTLVSASTDHASNVQQSYHPEYE